MIKIAHLKWTGLMLTLLFLSISCESHKQLSQHEKLADFKYLYLEFEKSYPYFDVNKRMNDVDWLSHKIEYQNRIKHTKDDKAFFKELTAILNDLNNDHTDTYPTVIYPYFYDGYNAAAQQDKSYLPYVEELQKTDSTRTAYWANINAEIISELESKDTKKPGLDIQESEENCTVQFLDSRSVAMIHIASFSYELVAQDKEKLKTFFAKAHNYNNVIIDIQGNDGGDASYWTEHIIPYLIKDTLKAPMTYAFKDSDRLKRFKPNYFKDIIGYEQISLPNTPQELKTGEFLFRRDSLVIFPSSKKRAYQGKKYLLVDDRVFSSAEMLAYFCKASQFAQVVGEKTSGDGVGTDPLLVTLPNSGIVIRFTGEMGLNPDGSANDESKTTPDILLEAPNNKERISKLLELIDHN